jgi:hypothetical protein
VVVTVCQLTKLTQQFIEDQTVLPVNPYGGWNESMLADEDLVSDINLYLQELRNNITAWKIVEFLAWLEVKDHKIHLQEDSTPLFEYLWLLMENIQKRTVC